MESLALLVSMLVLILSSASAKGFGEGGRLPVTCASNNTACDDTEDNHIEMIGEIKTIQECRQLCYDTNECEYITYYGPDSFPYREICFLFRQCSVTHGCTECVSETRDCFRTCGSNFVGIIDGNLLEGIPGVEIESDCWEHCKQKSNCRFYTYFQEEDPNSQTCVLLSHLMDPLQQCDHCVSGPANCGGDFVWDGEEDKFKMFTYSGGNEIDVLINLSFGASQFELRVLVTFVNIYPVF